MLCRIAFGTQPGRGYCVKEMQFVACVFNGCAAAGNARFSSELARAILSCLGDHRYWWR